MNFDYLKGLTRHRQHIRLVGKRMLAILLCLLTVAGVTFGHLGPKVWAQGGPFVMPDITKPMPSQFQNSSFEIPEVKIGIDWNKDQYEHGGICNGKGYQASAHIDISHDNLPGWSTTDTKNLIEIQREAPTALNQNNATLTQRAQHAADGDQYAEVNAEDRSQLYQVVPTVAGVTYFWQFAHAKRENGVGPDVLALLINDTLVETFSTNKVINAASDNWDYHYGAFVAAPGTTTTKFGFESVNRVGMGNFLDNIFLLSAPKLLLEKTMTANDPLRVGTTVTITVEITNWGEIDASNVQFNDTLDPGLTLVSGSITANGTPVANAGSGQQITLNLNNIGGSAGAGNNLNPSDPDYGMGETITVSFQATINASATSPIENQASVTYDALNFDNNSEVENYTGPWTDYSYVKGQTPTSGDSNTYVNRLYGTPDISVTKTVDQTTARPGETLTWTVTVTNQGIVSAANVVIEDTLPAVDNPQFDTPTIGSVSGGVWDIPLMPANSSATLRITGEIPSDAVPGSILTNQVEVKEIDGAPPTAPIIDDVDTTVNDALISITKAVDQTTAGLGDTLTWNITVSNNGNIAADNVVIVDTLPAVDNAQFGAPSLGNVSGGVWNIPSLPAGSSATLTVTGNVPSNTILGSTLTNVVKVTMIDGTAPAIPITDDASTMIHDAVISITKTVDKAIARPGDSLRWTVTVSNTGTVAADNLVITDTLPAVDNEQFGTPSLGSVSGGVWSIPSLPAGGSAVLVVTGDIPLGTTLNTNLMNKAEVIEIDGEEPATEISDSASTMVKAPVLSINKVVDRATARPGETLTWNITVSNSGNAAANNVIIEDTLPLVDNESFGIPSLGSVSGGVWSIPSLLAGESATLTVTADVPANASLGSILINVAEVTEIDGEEPAASIIADASTTVNDAVISINKVVDQAAAGPGEPLTWLITVSNNGNAAAENVVIEDTLPDVDNGQFSTPSLGSISGGVWSITNLPVGGSATLTVTGDIPLDAIPGSILTNQVEVTEINGTAPAIPIIDDASTTVNAAVLNIEKTVDKATAGPGETLTWIITVSNSGNIAADNVVIEDTLPTVDNEQFSTPSLGSVSGNVWSIPSIPANSSATLTVTGDIPVTASLDSTLNNRVEIKTIDGVQPTDPILDEVSTTVKAAILSITKTVDEVTASPGETLTWTITISNNGNIAADHVVITDTLPAVDHAQFGTPSLGSVSGGVWSIPSIAAQSSATLTVTGTIPSNAGLGSTLTNRAAVTTIDGAAPAAPIYDDASTTVNAAVISVNKTVNQATGRPGETLTWTITVSNSGNVAADDVVITDMLPTVDNEQFETPSSGNVSGGVWSIPSLPAGGSATLDITGDIPSGAAPGSILTNRVEVTEIDGTVPTIPITDDVSTTVNDAIISITKTVDKAAGRPGERLTWTITVSNSGNIAADHVVITDTLPTVDNGQFGTPSSGSVSSGVWSIPSIPANSSATLTVTGDIPMGTTLGTTLTNSVEVTAIDGAAPAIPIVDHADTMVNDAVINISKSVDRVTGRLGDTLTWTITVSNSGNIAATNVVIEDTLPAVSNVQFGTPSTGSVSGGLWSIPSIPARGSATLTVTGMIPLDAVPGDTLTNQVEVTKIDGAAPANPIVADASTVINDTVISILKVVDKATARPDNTLTWTITVSNHGNIAAANVVVEDTLPVVDNVQFGIPSNGSVSGGVWNIQSIPANDSVTLTVTGSVPADAELGSILTNQAEVIRISGAAPAVPIIDDASTLVNDAVLTIAKTVDRPVSWAGGRLIWTITVRNTGNAEAVNVVVEDTLPEMDNVQFGTPSVRTVSGRSVAPADAAKEDRSAVTGSIRLATSSNATPSNATSSDAIPSNTIPFSATPSGGTVNNGVWSIPSIPANGSATLTITADIPADAAFASTVTNTVEIIEIDGKVPAIPLFDDAVTLVHIGGEKEAVESDDPKVVPPGGGIGGGGGGGSSSGGGNGGSSGGNSGIGGNNNTSDGPETIIQPDNGIDSGIAGQTDAQDLVTILPEEVPLAPTLPKTGDESKKLFWLLLLGLSAAGIPLPIFLMRRKRQK